MHQLQAGRPRVNAVPDGQVQTVHLYIFMVTAKRANRGGGVKKKTVSRSEILRKFGMGEFDYPINKSKCTC